MTSSSPPSGTGIVMLDGRAGQLSSPVSSSKLRMASSTGSAAGSWEIDMIPGMSRALPMGLADAGVIGREKPFYDVWGDTVNLASRMESSGVADHVNVSAATHALIRDHFETAHRGAIEAKNKGRVEMYFVLGPRAGATQT